jgi:antitoxin YefM
MALTTTYLQARANLARLLDIAGSNREVVIVKRRGKGDVAMIAASELSSHMETAHLLRPRANAKRLLRALTRARANQGSPADIRPEPR